MSSRDDMVLRPTIEDHGSDAAARGKIARRIHQQRERGGLFTRIARAQLARRMHRGATRTAMRGLQAGVRGMRKFAGMGTQVFSSSLRGVTALINPTSMGAMAASAAGLLVYRHYTGATFSQMGSGINEFVLGKIDDEQRARVKVGQALASNDNLQMFVARFGVTDDIRKAAELMLPNILNEEVQKTAYELEFPAIDDLEIVVRALEWGIQTEWGSKDGAHKIRMFGKGLEAAYMGGSEEGGGR